METDVRIQRYRPGSFPWLHTGLLLAVSSAFALFLGFEAARTPAMGAGLGARLIQSLWSFPGAMFPLFPLIVGISVGTCRPGRGVVRSAGIIVVLTTLAMVSVDLFAPPSSLPSLLYPTWRQGAVVASPGDALEFEGRALPSVIRLLTSGASGIGEVLESYPPGHPRLMLTNGMFACLLMTLPAGVVGLMLGMGTWIRDRVGFRHDKDELLARIALAWTVAPMSLWLVTQFSRHAQNGFLFHGGSGYAILLPAAPFLVIGALGWWAALKAERDEDFGWSPVERGR